MNRDAVIKPQGHIIILSFWEECANSIHKLRIIDPRMTERLIHIGDGSGFRRPSAKILFESARELTHMPIPAYATTIGGT